MRLLTKIEISRLAVLTDNGVAVGLIEPTKVGLGKAFMDAIAELRTFLVLQGAHDYSTQLQGVIRHMPAVVLTPDDEFAQAEASLYRPKTKSGDPRIWFSRLHKWVSPLDVLAIAYIDGQFFVFNLTRSDLVKLGNDSGAFGSFIAPFLASHLGIVEELRGALEIISAKGFIQGGGSFDATIGALLESELGISANSSKAPDYKGIELKSARAGKSNRHNLFARVPDWKISALHSSQEILDAFGYEREGRRQLYCTVSYERANPQDLLLRIDEKDRLVLESSTRPEVPEVAAWRVSELENALSSKHAETFWVGANCKRDSGQEFSISRRSNIRPIQSWNNSSR